MNRNESGNLDLLAANSISRDRCKERYIAEEKSYRHHSRRCNIGCVDSILDVCLRAKHD